MTRLFKKDRLKSILTRFVFFYASRAQQNQKDTKEKQGYSIDDSTPIFIVDDQVFDTTLYVIDNNCKYYAASKNGIRQEWSPKYFLH